MFVTVHLPNSTCSQRPATGQLYLRDISFAQLNAGHLGGYSLKRANFQEPKSEISHSCFSDMSVVSEQAPSGNAGRSRSVAILGLALSFGATGVLFADSEATAAVGSSEIPTSANSSESPQLPSTPSYGLEHSLAGGRTSYHTVEHGDSLWQIAKEHRVEVQDIKTANRISPDATLQVGQIIKVPGENVTQPTLVSLLPGAQGSSGQQAQVPNLDRLVSGIADRSDSNSEGDIQATSPSVAVDEPSVIASEELNGTISLRSAGLMSQADGFRSDLKQIAAAQSQLSDAQPLTAETPVVDLQADSENASPSVVGSTDVSDMAFASYEVLPGDTVEDIAISLGTTPEQLTEANGLEDPNFIVAGDTLSVPNDEVHKLEGSFDGEVAIASASPELAASTSLRSFDGTRLSHLQSTVENRINVPSNTLDRLRGNQNSSGVSGEPSAVVSVPELEVPEETASIEDPYMANLLEKVSLAQASTVSAEAEVAQSDATGARIALQHSLPTVDNDIINPQFQGARLEARSTDSENSAPDSQLLAAAPLDPSVYVSSPNPAAGQVVSPEMPILPSADEYLPEAPDYFNGYIWPTTGTLTSGYGWRWGRMHRGIDVAGPVGTPIVSAAPGVVERAGWNSGGYGNLVDIRHPDGSLTRYAHNSRIAVRPGQQVAQGQHIADMGNTGFSTGPHLHFEIHLPSQGAVNPMAMLPNR